MPIEHPFGCDPVVKNVSPREIVLVERDGPLSQSGRCNNLSLLFHRRPWAERIGTLEKPPGHLKCLLIADDILPVNVGPLAVVKLRD